MDTSAWFLSERQTNVESAFKALVGEGIYSQPLRRLQLAVFTRSFISLDLATNSFFSGYGL
jgi:hypothetical protein